MTRAEVEEAVELIGTVKALEELEEELSRVDGLLKAIETAKKDKGLIYELIDDVGSILHQTVRDLDQDTIVELAKVALAGTRAKVDEARSALANFKPA